MRDMLQPVEKIRLDRTMFGNNLVDCLALLHASIIPDKKNPPKRKEE